MWTVAGNERIIDVDDGKVDKDTHSCDGKDDGKEGKNEDEYGSAWGEDVIDVTDGLLVGSDDITKFNNTSQNGFANEN